MTSRSAKHATFVIARTYEATPAQVFRAFSDPKAKAQWFAGPADWELLERSFDFRVGGRESNRGGPKGGPVHSFECRSYDIAPNEPIVYAYEMHLDDKRISVPLTTIELKPAGAGTQLTFTEQGVFLDGYDDAGSREQGSGWLLGKLADALREAVAT